MGKHQRDRARAKRAAFIPPSRPSPATTPLRSSAVSPFASLAVSAPSSSSPSSLPHHVDLLRCAFFEWLLALKALSSPHALWDRFIADWAAIPAHELPVQSSRPATLFSHVRALRSSNNTGALRKEVRQARAKLASGAAGDDGALKPHQTLLQWYLQGADAGQEQVVRPAQAGTTDGSEGAEQAAEQRERTEADGSSAGAKRKRADAAVGDGEEQASSTAGKRRKGAEQQPEPRTTSPLAANSNIWDALVDI